MNDNSNFSSFWQLVEQYCETSSCSASIAQDKLEKYGAITTGYSVDIPAVIWPISTEQVQHIVQLANSHSVCLYPISAGKNWGYSDSMPSSVATVLIDLSKMNKIVAIDEANKFAVIEPGVTQTTMSKALEGTSLFMDCTGAPEFTSIVGNILDRGFGHTPNGNRQQNACSFEIVLGNGEILRTGHLAYQNSGKHSVQNCHTKATTGPILDGLFSQSNFGIVTKLCFWLMPEPEEILPYIVMYNSHEDFLNAIEPIATLKQAGITRSIMHVGNDMRAISSSITYELLQPLKNKLITEDKIKATLSNLGIGPWVMSGALYGNKRLVKVYKEELKYALQQSCKCKIHFLPIHTITKVDKLLSKVPFNFLSQLKGKITSALALIDMHSGKPTNFFLKGSYHRHSKGYPSDFGNDIDIAKDGCGLIWISPTAPTSKEHISSLLSLLKHEFESRGFHLYATLSFIDDRSTAIICNPVFDVNDSDETERAIETTKLALLSCINAGYPSYRVANVHWDAWYETLSVEHQKALKELKKVFDPNGVLATGRYGIQ